MATAHCETSWETDLESERVGWQRFVDGPSPDGDDPSVIPGWDSPDSAAFGVLRLEPFHVRVLPGTLLVHGPGALLDRTD